MRKRSRTRGPDLAPGFPIRVGVVDMGSNAIRLEVAEFIAPATWTALVDERIPVRLGHGTYRTGLLEERAIDAAVGAMERFRDVLEELSVEHYRAVATSAVRESDNGRDLVRRVRKETGLRLETITGAEEARLVYWAVRRMLPLGSEPWLLVDLGGGSLEVAWVDAGGIRAVESHAVGSVRLLEELEDASGDVGSLQVLLREYLGSLRILELDGRPKAAGFVATGGNMEALAALAGAEMNEDGLAVVTPQALDRVVERLAGMGVERRIKKYGLREDRADVIVPAGLVYARLADLIGVDAIHVPRVGVKEGVMIDLVEGLTERAGYSARHARDTRAGAVALGRRFLFDEPHAVQVAHLAETLFDQLSGIHELDSDDREILAAAAVLHDVGQRISFKRHHKHSYYLISQSELPGFSTEEVELVANVARYHRKAPPDVKHDHFAALDEEDRERVTRMAALLRVADALDRGHRAAVSGIVATVDGDTLRLALEGGGDLERWAVERKCDLLEETFDLMLRISGKEDEDE